LNAEGRIYGGRYQVTEPIASGGMAQVYIANDQMLNRPVALKVLHPQFAEDKSFVERFRREAQAAASLNDPRIVSIFDWGSDNGTSYIVMEYVDGNTLRQIIEEEGPLTTERAVEIAADVCGALHLAHEKGIVHRDVKPANIAINRAGQTKVMDFGIARATSDAGQTVTQTGTVIGTANYLSPEQAQGESVDRRSDVYSTGVVLFEMLTQEVPFKADSAVAIAYKHVTEDPVPPSRLSREVPEDLDAVVLKALSKNPDNRYDTAEEMRQDLLRLLRGQPVYATPILPPDQTVVADSADRTSMFPADVPPDATPRRKALAYSLLFLLFASIIVLAGIFLFNLIGPGAEKVVVPDVVGKPVDEARRILEEKGFDVDESRAASESVPENSVISQEPGDGRKLEKGAEVRLVVSNGPDAVKVPNLIGKTKQEAERLLESAGLSLGSERSTNSDEVEAGKIVEQDPSSGEEVAKGRSVNIVISAGKKTARVPELVGLTLEKATEELNDAGLTTNVVDACDTSKDAGIVLKQDPTQGQQVPQGSAVTISVNRAQKVPGVEGKTEQEATTALQKAGFKVEVTHVDTGGDSGTVVRQDPRANEVACPGSSVTITVVR